jgi:hypothetical protein
MSILVYSHANAEEILKTRGGGRAFEEIEEFAVRLPLIQHAGKSDNSSLIYLQTSMNRILDYALPSYGWSRQVRQPGGFVSNIVDFYKFFAVDLRVWLEVEFGNTARSDSDIAKLRHAIDKGLSDVNVIILPVAALGKKMDENVASFERVARALISDRGHLEKPHLVIGIEEDPAVTLDVAGWGLPLEELKSSSHSSAKEEVYRRAWLDYMLPSLPANSCYHAHQRQVARTDIDYSQFQPAFPGFVDEVLDAPVIKRYGVDGSVTLVKDIKFSLQKKRKRKPRSKYPRGFKAKLSAVRKRKKRIEGFFCSEQRHRVYARVRCNRLRDSAPVVQVPAPVEVEQAADVLRDLYRQALSGDVELPDAVLARIETVLFSTAPAGLQSFLEV